MQITMFVLSCFSYGSVHIYREFWSQAKPEIEDDYAKYHCTKETLSNVDFVNFLVYGFSQFVNGPLADNYNLKKLLPIVYLI